MVRQVPLPGSFKAPIAGIVFTMEVLMLDSTMASLVPLMFTAITSYVVTFFLMGDGFVFSYQITDKFVMAISRTTLYWASLPGCCLCISFG